MAGKTDKDRLLELIPQDGSNIGNISLRNKLNWEPVKYWRVRDELISNDTIGLGLGYGGSVYRKNPIEIKNKKDKIHVEYSNEKALYEPFVKSIQENYTKDLKISDFIIQNTSSQGSKSTGGQWTRPDITLITVQKYSFVPGTVMDIVSFELKSFESFNITGVFETASHSRFANKSFYVGYLPNGLEESFEIDRMKSECERFGIGLMYFKDPKTYDTFSILVEPNRQIPDPADQDEFISQQISDLNKRKLGTLIR